MKTIRTYHFIFLSLIVCFWGCQEEFEEITPIDTNEVISGQTELFESVRNISLLDGSYDDILDGANCFLVKLPVTISIGSQILSVSTPEDFKEIENTLILLQKTPSDIQYNYPIQIIFADYSETTVSNLQELTQYKNSCISDGSDDDIECIDFIYPFDVYKYDAVLEKGSNETITSDEQLFQFLSGLDSLDIFSFNYPITTTYENGTAITISNNTELESIINADSDTCEENDLTEWDPVTAALTQTITTGNWVASMFYDSTGLSDQLIGIDFAFGIDGEINANTEIGEWQIYQDNDSLIFAINFDSELNLSAINREWNVLRYTDSEIVLQYESEDSSSSEYLVFNKSNPNTALKTNMQTGSWIVSQFIDSGNDETVQYNGYSFTFDNSEQLTITDGVAIITGNWLPVSDLILVLDIDDSPFNKLRNDWQVSSYDASQVTLIDASSGSTLVFTPL